MKTVIFLGQNGLSFRGKLDSGPVDLDSEIKTSEGNFKNLIKFRIEAGDNVLKDHVSDSKKNAMYLSPKIQNSLIDSCGEIILESILSEVKEV